MRVIAEGVETETQYALLRASGCDEVQGYLIGRPLSVQQLYELFDGQAASFKAIE
jgi:EAL domain-containing protein (putative c-di-GMP-specific phosphodiesterase class I)